MRDRSGKDAPENSGQGKAGETADTAARKNFALVVTAGGAYAPGLAPLPVPRTVAAEARAFALTLGGALLAIAAFLWWRDRPVAAAWLGGVGAAMLVAGAGIPSRLAPVMRGWMAFGRLLSRITTPIVLGTIYFLVITPIGLVRRAAGKNSLRHAMDADSYWKPVQRRADPRRAMERQF